MPSHQAAREKRRSEPDGDIDYITREASVKRRSPKTA
jgi:hypothetical protein